MDPFEIAGASLGIVCVALIIRRNVWNFPFGIAMVVVYAWVFYQAKLYSDALLQLYYIGIQVYGWSHWLRHRDAEGTVIVETLSASHRAKWLGVIAAGTIGLGWVMATKTDAALPWWDACTTIMSVVAQFLLSRRKIENWVLWIAVDVISIVVYWTKDLHVTAGLYVVFLAMAIVGLVTWSKSMRGLPTGRTP